MGFQHKTYAACGAKCKRTGQACKNPVVNGSTKCRLHGGKSPRGAMASQFSHGYYSRDNRLKTLWQAFQRNYKELLQDERAARWLEDNPMPKPADYKSAKAYMKAATAWKTTYFLFKRTGRKTDKITASEASAAYEEYCEAVGSRDFWDVYMLAVFGINLQWARLKAQHVEQC